MVGASLWRLRRLVKCQRARARPCALCQGAVRCPRTVSMQRRTVRRCVTKTGARVSGLVARRGVSPAIGGYPMSAVGQLGRRAPLSPIRNPGRPSSPSSTAARASMGAAGAVLLVRTPDTLMPMLPWPPQASASFAAHAPFADTSRNVRHRFARANQQPGRGQPSSTGPCSTYAPQDVARCSWRMGLTPPRLAAGRPNGLRDPS